MKTIEEIINEGSWDYKPLNSDGALDLRDGQIKWLFKELVKEMHKSLDSNDEYNLSWAWDAVGVGMYYLECFYKEFPFLFENSREEQQYVELCYETFERLLHSEKWLSGWKSKDKIIKSINDTKDKLDQLIDKINKKWKQ